MSSSSSSSRTSSACVSLCRATRTSARPPRSQVRCRLKAGGWSLDSSPPACPAWLGSGQGVHSGQVPRAKAGGGRPRTHRARAARTAGILPETVDAGLRRKALERFREINSAWVARADVRGHRAGSAAPPPPPTPISHHPHTHTASGLTAALCFRPAGLKLWGAPIFTTNIKDFKRVSGEKGE